MRRPNRYCLTRQLVRMSWNPQNCYNITQRKPLNDRHLNLYQTEWKSKALGRMYFGGDITESTFRKLFASSGRNIFQTLSQLEKRLDNLVFRCMLASSVFQARKMVSTGQILVNGDRVRSPGHLIKVGDVLQVNTNVAANVYKFADHPMIRIWSFIPAYLEVDYATLSAVLIKEPQYSEIPNPFPRHTIENMNAFYTKIC